MLLYDTNKLTATLSYDNNTYLPPPFTSSGNDLRVRFVSNGQTTMKGFKASYKQVGELLFVFLILFVACLCIDIYFWICFNYEAYHYFYHLSFFLSLNIDVYWSLIEELHIWTAKAGGLNGLSESQQKRTRKTYRSRRRFN